MTPFRTNKPGPVPGQRDLPFRWWEAVRSHSVDLREYLIAHADITPTLRRMLMALHRRCHGKRICWPSQATLADDLGYQWPGCRRTIQRQLERLKKMGLLLIEYRVFEGSGERGQTSSVYAIRYGALRALVIDYDKKRPPRGSGQGAAGGRSTHRRGAVKVAPLELNRRELNRNEFAASSGETEPTTPARPKDGGGEYADYSIQDRYPVADARKNCRPSGWWAGAVTRSILTDRANVVTLYKSAVTAGVIKDTLVNRVRVIALVIQALSMSDEDFKTSLGGYVISHIERGTWNYLQPQHVKEALKRLSGELKLSQNEVNLVRLADTKGAL